MPPVQPGEVRNPTGKPKGYCSPTEWLTALSVKTRKELQRIVGDESSTATKVAAARQLLRAMHKDEDHNEFGEVADRLDGKATANSNLHVSGEVTTKRIILETVRAPDASS